MNKCRHFNGVQNNRCRADVEYHSLVGRLPCVADPGENIAKCNLCDRYSDEEVSAIKARRRESIAFVIAAISEIAKIEGSFGEIECPKCKGRLNWTRASYNGHVHAKCKTDKCVSFLQ